MSVFKVLCISALKLGHGSDCYQLVSYFLYSVDQLYYNINRLLILTETVLFKVTIPVIEIPNV